MANNGKELSPLERAVIKMLTPLSEEELSAREANLQKRLRQLEFEKADDARMKKLFTRKPVHIMGPIVAVVLTVLNGVQGCASSKPAAVAPAPVQRAQWTLTVDTTPSGAVVMGIRSFPDGSQRFEALGITPLAVRWVQSGPREVIKVVSGQQSVTVVPQPDQPILVDFSVTPIRVAGAAQL